MALISHNTKVISIPANESSSIFKCLSLYNSHSTNHSLILTHDEQVFQMFRIPQNVYGSTYPADNALSTQQALRRVPY